MTKFRALAPAVLAGAALYALVLALLAYWPYPELGCLLERPYSLRVLDARGEPLSVTAVDGGIRREWTALADIPPAVRDAFVIAEDRWFWLHPGVNPLAAARAFLQNREAGRVVSGAATLTMQVARMAAAAYANAGPGTDAEAAPFADARAGGMAAKLRESMNAFLIEARLPKARILELYLNNVPFGRGAEGVRSAAFRYFGKPLDELSRVEAGLLAVVPRSPGAYDPGRYPDETGRAAWRSLGSSRTFRETAGPAGAAAFVDAAKASRPGAWPFRAPHFTRWLISTRPDVAAAREAPTTLDPGLQVAAERLLAEAVDEASANRITTGAVLVLDAHTGAVLAWVGSRDFADEANDGQVDGVLSLYQPGSCLKPFLYELALERGFTPATVLPDIPLEFGQAEVYLPLNYNNRFNGPVRLRVALASSLNVPAVYVLERLGVQAFCDRLVDLGFDSIEAQRGELGVGLALGNARVSLLELTRAFVTFPRGGETLELRPLKNPRVRRDAAADADGVPVMTRYGANLVCSILSDDASRFAGFGAGRTMNTDFDAIFKTGTANQFQSVWALGATPDYVVGVWMGNFTGETVVGRSGSGIPARVAARVLSRLAIPGSAFPKPEGAREYRVCSLSGGTPTDACPSVVSEWVPYGEEPAPCDYHVRAGSRVDVRYPPEYARWLRDGGRSGTVDSGEGSPRFLRPTDGAVYFYDPSAPGGAQAIAVEVAGGADVDLGLTVDGAPVSGRLPDGRWFVNLRTGRHRLELRNGPEVFDAVTITVE